MKPYVHFDSKGNMCTFHAGTINTVGPVTLTPNAATDLASVLLQWASQQRVDGVRQEYVPASEYRGLHG